MLCYFTPARSFWAVLAIFVLAGCVGKQGPLPAEPPQPTTRTAAPSRVKPDTYPTPELRIPGEAVARDANIPVVPVPPVPLGQATLQRTTVPPMMPEIKQVSTAPPASQLPITPVHASPMETGDIKQVIQQTNDAYGQIDSYIARLTRREQINGKNKPEEVMLFKFRKQPWSLYFKWLGTEGHDREVVFVKGQYEGKIHTLLAAGDVPFTPAGKKMALAPDSFLVKSAARYPITEAGMGASIDRITALAAAIERGDTKRGTLTDLGIQKRADYPVALRVIEHRIPPDVEEPMPRGGKRLYHFDVESRLPVLLICLDDKGQEVEYYRYDRVMPVKLDDADFNPANMGAPSKLAQKP